MGLNQFLVDHVFEPILNNSIAVCWGEVDHVLKQQKT